MTALTELVSGLAAMAAEANEAAAIGDRRRLADLAIRIAGTCRAVAAGLTALADDLEKDAGTMGGAS